MARSQEQNEKMRQKRKERIRVAALKEFADRGLSATRIADIAAGAGMARGLLYHYYPSKEAVYADLIDDALSKLNEAALYLRDKSAPAREKILFALREIMQTIGASGQFCQTSSLIAQAMSSSTVPPHVRRSFEKKREIPYQAMATIMKAGQEEGSVVGGDSRVLATLFWTSVNGLAIYYATREEAGELPDYHILARMFLQENVDERKEQEKDEL